jgi:tryptophan-rich sensory protein
LVAALATTFVAAAVGGFAALDAVSFYAELSKPSWAPPPWLFGPVWTVLYTLMAVAVWWVWRTAGLPRANTAVYLFAAQLVSNALWSWFFFAWRSGPLAIADIAILWVLLAATILAFWRLQRLAALLLVPYLVWVSFAAALTVAVWQRNPVLQ